MHVSAVVEARHEHYATQSLGQCISRAVNSVCCPHSPLAWRTARSTPTRAARSSIGGTAWGWRTNDNVSTAAHTTRQGRWQNRAQCVAHRVALQQTGPNGRSTLAVTCTSGTTPPPPNTHTHHVNDEGAAAGMVVMHLLSRCWQNLGPVNGQVPRFNARRKCKAATSRCCRHITLQVYTPLTAAQHWSGPGASAAVLHSLLEALAVSLCGCRTTGEVASRQAGLARGRAFAVQVAQAATW